MKRFNVIGVVVFVIAFIALVVMASNPHFVRRMQQQFLGLLTPFMKSGSTFERKYSAFREGLKTLDELEAEVDKLRVANKEMSATNQTLRGLESENNRLRAALGYHERSVFQLMPAQIIGRDPSAWYSTIVIDRGSDQLIAPDMPVITEEGLVGKTTIVSRDSTVVVLISDEGCKVAANVEGTRVQGIVRGERSSGTGVPQIAMRFLSKQANLQPHQKVFTSGAGEVFPPGVLIGEIGEFEVRELEGYATVTSAVDLTTLQDVFVVVSDTK